MVCVFVAAAVWIAPAYAQPPKMVHADDRFNGREVELQVGDMLEIKLAENASTGFQWAATPESAQKVAKLLRAGETGAEGVGEPPGRPGVRHFTFEAIEPGTVELVLNYRRPWETGKAPARKFRLYIHVRPAD